MTFPWPDSFPRIPDEDWTRHPIEELAKKYDTVQRHGWYSNLERTLDQLRARLAPGDLLIDYSGGTGILADKLLHRLDAMPIGVVIVDSSPKFLRLALEKLRHDPRVAFREIRWLRDEKRLQLLDEVLPPGTLDPADALVSTNAVHLYHDLHATLASWRRTLRKGARVFVQSGNIRNPDAVPGDWIIDETVNHVHEAASEIVRGDDRWSTWRSVLEDAARMTAHAAVREKFFLPVRPLEHYLAAFATAGFRIVLVDARRVEARVDEWRQFLSTYHEGVLGWVGGSRRVEGKDPDEGAMRDRLELIGLALNSVFGGRPTFPCCWTYITAETAGTAVRTG